MFTGRTKTIRIIGDPDDQRPDKWKCTVCSINMEVTGLKVGKLIKYHHRHHVPEGLGVFPVP